MIFVFYLLPTVPKYYWVATIILLGFSIPLDLAWVASYSPYWWSSGNEHINSVGFQRYSIVMSSILLILKAYSGVLLFIGFRPTNS